MNKHSAIVVATSLTVALLVGGLALTQGLVGSQPSAAAVGAPRKHKPIIRTKKRTITVHEKPPARHAVAGSFTGSSFAGYSGGSSYSSGSDDAFEGGTGDQSDDQLEPSSSPDSSSPTGSMDD